MSSACSSVASATPHPLSTSGGTNPAELDHLQRASSNPTPQSPRGGAGQPISYEGRVSLLASASSIHFTSHPPGGGHHLHHLHHHPAFASSTKTPSSGGSGSGSAATATETFDQSAMLRRIKAECDIIELGNSVNDSVHPAPKGQSIQPEEHPFMAELNGSPVYPTFNSPRTNG